MEYSGYNMRCTENLTCNQFFCKHAPNLNKNHFFDDDFQNNNKKNSLDDY